jgi:hypothetical protein
MFYPTDEQIAELMDELAADEQAELINEMAAGAA